MCNTKHIEKDAGADYTRANTHRRKREMDRGRKGEEEKGRRREEEENRQIRAE